MSNLKEFDVGYTKYIENNVVCEMPHYLELEIYAVVEKFTPEMQKELESVNIVVLNPLPEDLILFKKGQGVSLENAAEYRDNIAQIIKGVLEAGDL